MDLSWLASAYGLVIIAMICMLLGFIVSRGVYYDKDDKILKIGNKKQSETLDQYTTLAKSLKDLPDEIVYLQEQIKQLTNTQRSMHITLLKFSIIMEQLPVDARVEAYDRYRKLGGNSWVIAYYKKEIQPLLEKQFQGMAKK